MKRIVTTLLAASMLIAPVSIVPAASAQGYGRGDQDRDRDRNNNGRGERWDHNRHNGYMWQGRWYYGPPSAAYYGRPGFSVGYHQWRRGERLPAYYRDRFRPVDYRAYRLRPPPRGYHYVRDDRGDILLVAIATGIIVSAILNNG
jgi:Ni/Co efflux regulator RcnB